MRGRTPERFQLKSTDKAYLRKLLRDGETPWRIARCILCDWHIPDRHLPARSPSFPPGHNIEPPRLQIESLV